MAPWVRTSLCPELKGKVVSYTFSLSVAGTKKTVTATPVSVNVEPVVPLSGAAGLASDAEGYCAVLTFGGVDCWGDGLNGELGNGVFYTSGSDDSETPVQVVGVGGSGVLSGVASVASDAYGEGYCALLTSGEVDCWGYGASGELGDGEFYTSGNEGSATPVQLVGVGGIGMLSGVANSKAPLTATVLSSTPAASTVGEAALMANSEMGSPLKVRRPFKSSTPTGPGRCRRQSVSPATALDLVPSYPGGVDCWGFGRYGELGNGIVYTTGNDDSATPVQVVGVGGTGVLSGVASLASDGGGSGYCAVLTSDNVDCWGEGGFGELGNGDFYTSFIGTATPVSVVGVGGSGLLSGVANIDGDGGLVWVLRSSNLRRRRLLGPRPVWRTRRRGHLQLG